MPAVDGVTYLWTIFNGTLGTATGDSVSFVANDIGEVVLACSGTNAANDVSPEAVAVVASIAAATTPQISAPPVVTEGRIGLPASVATTPGITYAWTATNGTIASGAAANSIVFTAGTPGPLQLSVVAANAAGDAAPAGTATLTVRPHGLDLVAGALGGSGFADGTGADARFDGPEGIAYDPAGNAYVADGANRA